ncbi:zinc ribbon domain-containing protein [Acidocella sp. MX-AZ03]|uniref:zinc ribbon domain-containing protein n=1 Tax=Acidocella sp. MX-AZ03 TaxID=2697363 RepID=UPI0022DE8F88|nr:zinc ribbon domain-containing protein [Acidocella sp. MX-AZ03]WBO61037.1 zinc ribbon domain-containing protein [Acidocella sp. MX-AZ03]
MEVPSLRIVDQELWDQVQGRLANIRDASGANKPDRPKFWEKRRAKHLLTNKVFCACCGHVLSAFGGDYLACGPARRRGTCSNRTSLKRARLESAVIEALRHNLMDPEAVGAFVTEFTAEWNRLAAESNANRVQEQNRLNVIQRKLDKIVEAIMDGFRSDELKQQLDDLSQQKASLQERLAAPAAPAPAIHPNLAGLYRQRVAALHTELAAANGSNNASLEAMRDLIERIEVGPAPKDGEPQIILTGALASMVRLGLPPTPTKTTPSARSTEGVPDLFMSSVLVVAGPGFEPGTFRL